MLCDDVGYNMIQNVLCVCPEGMNVCTMRTLALALVSLSNGQTNAHVARNTGRNGMAVYHDVGNRRMCARPCAGPYDDGALREPAPEEQKQASMGALGSLFARLTGSKILTEADLKPVLEGMKQHLMKKNVAKEISEKVCEGVGESLVGKKVGGFQSEFSVPNMIPMRSLHPIFVFSNHTRSQPRTRPYARPCP